MLCLDSLSWSWLSVAIQLLIWWLLPPVLIFRVWSHFKLGDHLVDSCWLVFVSRSWLSVSLCGFCLLLEIWIVILFANVFSWFSQLELIISCLSCGFCLLLWFSWFGYASNLEIICIFCLLIFWSVGVDYQSPFCSFCLLLDKLMPQFG